VELIGRDSELDLVITRLEQRRLVTVMGPGGIGKTALARAAVTRAADSFPLGAMTIDLTRVDSADAVGDTIAAQLGFPSFEALVLSPGDQPVLLLVDNCDHVTDAAASAVSELLDACAAPTVLATSRSPLDVPGEAVVVLGPLQLPAAGFADPSVAALRLFLDRAHDAGAVVPEADLEVVGELCRRLDGLPLALELAAARSRSMTPPEILAHLDERLDVLARPRFRGAARHRSLRATIGWSHSMLDPVDARVFDRLAVFAGPFTIEMAHAVVSEPDREIVETLGHLDALVAASLVVADRDGRRSWYRLLETLRAFALEELQARGELSATWERFVDHVVAVTGSMVDRARSAWTAALLDEHLVLYDNIAAAIRWCVANDAHPDRALELVAALWGMVHQGHVADVTALGERVLERVLERWPDPGAPAWPDAVATVATCRYLAGRPRDAIQLAERALAEPGASPFAVASLHRVIGLARRALGDTTGSLAAFAEGAAEARAHDLYAIAMELDVAHAIARADVGDVHTALAEVRASREEAAQRHADLNESFAAASEGYIMLRRDPVAAIPIIEAGIADARKIPYPAMIARNLRSLALAHVATGALRDAARDVLDLLDNLAHRGDLTELRVTLEAAALVLERANRPAWADLAATAATLPVVSINASVGREPLPLPAHRGQRLSNREAFVTARRELEHVLDAVAPPVVVPAQPAGGAVFRQTGDFWEIQFAGRSAHLKPTKGMADLGRLLAQPGREVHSVDLVGAAVDQSATGEVIDGTARRQYEQRIRDLQDEIDEAVEHHDYARSERAQAEYDTLVDHLTAALGLAGRPRTSGDSAERARSAVTQRLRATIRRIADSHPPLGRHLDVSIKTGTYCSYQPEHPVDWQL
jgi:predicted ATPase